MLGVEDGDSDGVGDFFDDGGEDHEAEADGVSGDDEEGDLPGESASGKAVVEAGMGNGWGILLPDFVEDEIERRDDEHAIDAGDVEDVFGKFHRSCLQIDCWYREISPPPLGL